jgi:protein-disulfide isomerase
MKRVLSFIAIALFATAAFAADGAATTPLDARVEKAIRDSLPPCPGLKLTPGEMPYKLPTGFSGTVIRVESSPSRAACDAQLISIISPTGGFYLGVPWYFGDEEGTTPEEKLKNFAYRNMRMLTTAVIDRTSRTLDGLFRVALTETTDAGKVVLDGEMDQAGTIFFFGHFRRMNSDMRVERLKVFEPLLPSSPTKGAKDAQVTVIEFSDFECPSCQRASGYVDPILAKYPSQVRYIRFDLPLSGHPWAFSAAVAGRAVYRQKPELFWEFKKQVYTNQDKLSAFTFDDFARGFAESHELDMKRWDADVSSDAIRAELLKGVGLAFSNDIRATPSYIINGAFVDAGDGGKALMEYVDKLLAK